MKLGEFLKNYVKELELYCLFKTLIDKCVKLIIFSYIDLFFYLLAVIKCLYDFSSERKDR